MRGYAKTVNDYRAGANNLGLVNFSSIVNFLNRLEYNDGKRIGLILLCPPKNLKRLHILLKEYFITNPFEEQVIELAFNYDRFSDIADEIRNFFNRIDFAKHCPYCNREETAFLDIEGGRKVSGHELDHFFSQKDFPLLSYSLFNLVPSGEKCNGPILKGQKEFNDDYHLNPYIDGFGDMASFIPVVVNKTVEAIQLKINPVCGSSRVLQLVGPDSVINQSLKEGNINIFGLERRYQVNTDEAERMLRCLRDNNNGFRSIAKYVQMMLSGIKKESIHRNWYAKYVGTPFEPENFSKKMLSKFNRDIHDSYYKDDSKIYNDFVREMIRY